jgi:hypothetical protein
MDHRRPYLWRLDGGGGEKSCRLASRRAACSCLTPDSLGTSESALLILDAYHGTWNPLILIVTGGVNERAKVVQGER